MENKGQFKEGNCANPNGRPKKGNCLTELAKAYLDKKKGKKTNKDLFIENVYKLAMEGDVACIRLIWNYIDGMPVQNVAIDDMTKNPLMEKLERYENTIDTDNT